MNQWREVEFEEIFDISSSKRVLQADWKSSGVPFYRAREIVKLAKDGVVQNDLFISEDLYETFKHGHGVPKTGDLMVSAVGTLGACYVVQPQDRFYYKDASVLRFSPKHELCSKFMQHAFRTPEIVDQIQASSGSTVGTYTIQRANKTQIKLPPLPEQRRIAAILDQADALRAKRREVLTQLDSLTQSIFIEMFGEPTANVMRWPTKRLSDLVFSGDSINYGVVQPGDDVGEGIPLVRVGDLIDGRVRHDSLKKIAPEIESAYKRSRLHGDEILVSCVGTIGVVVLAKESEMGFNIARAVARIRLSPATSREFVAAQLLTESVQRYFTEELRTVSQPTLNIKQLSETKLIWPPVSLQAEFSNRIASLEKLKLNVRRASSELDSLFASLQHRAFRGDL